MNYAHLDDGRRIIVDTSRQMTRLVGDEEFFLSPGHVNALLDGHWHVIRRSRIKKLEYGNPWQKLQ